MLASLREYDTSGELAATWTRPVPVALYLTPENADVHVFQDHIDATGDRQRKLHEPHARHAWELVPGTYLFVIRGSAEHEEVRYPLRVAPGTERLGIALRLPTVHEVPDGMVYMPPGDYFLGHGQGPRQERERTGMYATRAVHQRTAPGLFIARYETTLTQWMQFLDSLPADERARYLPDASDDDMAVRLTTTGDGYRLHYQPSPSEEQQLLTDFTGTRRELIRYPARESPAVYNWHKFPVTGISPVEIQVYLSWLDSTGQVPGARLCTEAEWLHAARGADTRRFPHGNTLNPEDANFDDTYGRTTGAYGFDEVGSHPASMSPYGVHDMSGNAREVTHSLDEAHGFMTRSGSYLRGDITNVIINRDPTARTQKRADMGFRVCADVPGHLR